MAVACPWSVPLLPFSRIVRPNSDMVRTTTQVAIERGQGKTQLAQPCGQLAFARALVHMRVPAAAIGERDLQPYIGFDQLRDLQQGSAQAARRILRAISGTVLRGVGAL